MVKKLCLLLAICIICPGAAIPEKPGSDRYISDDQRTERVYESTDFSEGRAWVRLGNRGDIISIIDTQGQLVVAINTEWTPPLGSTFKDGLTYIKGFEGRNSNYNDMIIDRNGDVNFEAEDENFKILGYGNGRFLAAKHAMGMTVNEWQLGAIDKDGNTVVPFKSYIENLDFESGSVLGDAGFVDCEYIGEDIFLLELGSYNVLLNIETQSLLLSPEINAKIQLLTGFENGYATALYYDSEAVPHPLGNGGWVYNKYLCKVGTDGSVYDQVNNNWVQYILGSKYSDIEFSEGLIFFPFDNDNGLVYKGFGEDFVYNTGVYYNMSGEIAIDFPEYRGKLNFFGGSFYNGNAIVQIKGLDGLNYFTVIDKNGNPLFEPRSDYSNLIIANDGQLIAQVESDRAGSSCYHVMDINGDMLMTVYAPANNNRDINISDGMLRISGAGRGNVYVNMSDGSVVGTYDTKEFSVELHSAAQ